jgi:HSP20 family protein
MRYTLGNTVLNRHGSYAPPLSLRQMMDRLVEQAFVPPPDPTGQTDSVGGPALDAYEEGDQLVVEARLPGMKPKEIDVSIEQGVLTIQGETKAEEREERTYLIREHRTGRFSRSMHLPETVDTDAVQATYVDGILRLRLAKAEPTKAQRIQIEAGDQKSVNGTRGTERPAEAASKSAAADGS